MKNAVAALLLLVAGTTFAAAETDEEFRALIVGSWSASAECTDDLLIFRADGTFTSGDREGTWQVAGGKLSGKAGETAMPEVTLKVVEGSLVFVGSQGEDKLFACKGG